MNFILFFPFSYFFSPTKQTIKRKTKKKYLVKKKKTQLPKTALSAPLRKKEQNSKYNSPTTPIKQNIQTQKEILEKTIKALSKDQNSNHKTTTWTLKIKGNRGNRKRKVRSLRGCECTLQFWEDLHSQKWVAKRR